MATLDDHVSQMMGRIMFQFAQVSAERDALRDLVAQLEKTIEEHGKEPKAPRKKR